jgi:hypothetical protein
MFGSRVFKYFQGVDFPRLWTGRWRMWLRVITYLLHLLLYKGSAKLNRQKVVRARIDIKILHSVCWCPGGLIHLWLSFTKNSFHYLKRRADREQRCTISFQPDKVCLSLILILRGKVFSLYENLEMSGYISCCKQLTVTTRKSVMDLCIFWFLIIE